MFDIFIPASKNYENLDGATFKTKFRGSQNAELLDVRTPGEFASGSIKGARNLDVASPQFQDALKTLDRDKEYFLFCRSGSRSGTACNMMATKGFKVYNLAGGVSSWPN